MWSKDSHILIKWSMDNNNSNYLLFYTNNDKDTNTTEHNWDKCKLNEWRGMNCVIETQSLWINVYMM